MPETHQPVQLNALIHRVKRDLLTPQALTDDPVPLFAVEEVTVEVNFVVSGGANGKIDLQVVSAGAEVRKENVQKAVIKLKPLVPPGELVQAYAKRSAAVYARVMEKAVEAFVKGNEQPAEQGAADFQD